MGVRAGADHASKAAVNGESILVIPQADFFFDIIRSCK